MVNAAEALRAMQMLTVYQPNTPQPPNEQLAADTWAYELREFEAFVDVKRYFLGRPLGSVSARTFLRHAVRVGRKGARRAAEAELSARVVHGDFDDAFRFPCLHRRLFSRRFAA